ncbi:MAG: META domain-containing protein [Alphaproteobacteria bacterium]
MKKILFTIVAIFMTIAGSAYAMGDKKGLSLKESLNGTFVLYAFDDGKEIPIPADKSWPTFKLNPEDKTITGFAGCNNIRGSFEASKNKITFGAIAATKKACFNDEFEPKILPLFTKINSFERKDNLLTLKENDKILMTWRKLNLD